MRQVFIEKSAWGLAPDGPTELFTLRNGGVELRATTLGATVVGLTVPDSGASGLCRTNRKCTTPDGACPNRDGADTVMVAGEGSAPKNGLGLKAAQTPLVRIERRKDFALDVVLGFDRLEDYLADQCYFGCIVGRVANRISGAAFELDGQCFELDRNAGRHHLHGGSRGVHRRVWRAEADHLSDGPALRLETICPDGDMGYPGEVRMAVVYTVLEDGLRLDLEYSADRRTPVNPASHMYFNLSGPGTTCLDHTVRINASRALELDDESIPTGRVLAVDGTPLDFRRARRVGEDVDALHPWTSMGHGYDQYLVLDRTEQPKGLAHAARVESPDGLRSMDVWTESAGLQLYSGNFIPDGLRGKGGVAYPRRAGLCLEFHGYVNAPNRPNFPGVTVTPGKVYTKRTEYRFSR